MAEICVIKSFRLTPELAYKLEELHELSGLSQSEIVRLSLTGMKTIKEKPSKELLSSLLKLNNIGNNINQIARHANTFDEIDYNTLKVCVANLNSMVNDIRRHYLQMAYCKIKSVKNNLKRVIDYVANSEKTDEDIYLELHKELN